MHPAHRLGPMDESSLRVFLSLCRTESTRDTAAHLGVDQSTVSRTLSRLERTVGVRLFERRGRTLRLGQAGASLRTDATRILEAVDAARRHLQASLADEVVRLGFVPSVGRWLIPPLLRGFRSHHPDSAFELRGERGRELTRLVRDDVIDLAVTTAPRAGETGLEWHPLQEEQLVLATARDHRFASRRPVPVADLTREAFIAYDHETDLRAAVDAILQRSGVRVDVSLESGELETVHGLVASGLGIAIVPERSAVDDAHVVHTPLHPPAFRPLGVVWRADGRRSPSAEAFLEHVCSAGGAR